MRTATRDALLGVGRAVEHLSISEMLSVLAHAVACALAAVQADERENALSDFAVVIRENLKLYEQASVSLSVVQHK